MSTQTELIDWYAVLGVAPDASADEIRAAWRSAVADLDPTDRRFRVYNQAAEVLLDPAGRTVSVSVRKLFSPRPVFRQRQPRG